MKYWKIKTWIEVDEEIPDVWDNLDEAAEEIVHLKNMQPENHYECVPCDENGEEL